MINDSSKLEKGQFLNIELNKVKDRLPKKIFIEINKNPSGKLVGYKMVDGNQFGLALELENGAIVWFFEDELTEIEREEPTN